MKHFYVTVRTPECMYAYIAVAACSTDVINQAIDRFGVCSVFVRGRA